MDEEFYKIIKTAKNRKKIGEFLGKNLLSKRQIFTLIRKISKKKGIPISKILTKIFGRNWKDHIFLIPTKGVLQAILSQVNKCHPDTILELSAGHGVMSAAISQIIPQDIKYIAVDSYDYKFSKDSVSFPVKNMSDDDAIRKYGSPQTMILAFYPGNGLSSVANNLVQRKKVSNILYIGWSILPREIRMFGYKIRQPKIQNNDLLSYWTFRSQITDKMPDKLGVSKNKIGVLLFNRVAGSAKPNLKTNNPRRKKSRSGQRTSRKNIVRREFSMTSTKPGRSTKSKMRTVRTPDIIELNWG